MAARAAPSALSVDLYDDDWTRLAWVQALGTTRVEDAAAHPPVVAALAAKYVPYRDQPPGGSLLRLEPDRVLSWRAAPALPGA